MLKHTVFSLFCIRVGDNFNGKVSSTDGRLNKSNIIDNFRFFEELWDIIGVSVFWDMVYYVLFVPLQDGYDFGQFTLS